MQNDPNEGAFLFLSELVGAPVLSPDGTRLGRVADMSVDASEPAYPKVKAIRVRRAGVLERVDWADIAECVPGRVRLKRAAEAFIPPTQSSGEIRLVQDVLDRQIVDIQGAKVERVNDLHLIRARGELRVAHVDVGFRGLVRRMGWQTPVDAMIKMLRPRSPYLATEKFVRWKFVQPLSSNSPRVKLDVTRSALAGLHPADLVEIFEDLDRRERAVLFRGLSVEAAAETLEEADSELQRELLKVVEPELAADLLEAMEPDDAADLLKDLPAEESTALLAEMDAAEAREVEQLLVYEENSAGGLMTPDFLRVTPEHTVAQTLDDFRAQAPGVKHVHDAFAVSAEGKLVGTFSLRDLLLASPTDPVRPLLRDHPAPLSTGDGARQIAELAAKYNLLTLPVLDDDRRMVGVVTIDDVVEQVVHG